MEYTVWPVRTLSCKVYGECIYFSLFMLVFIIFTWQILSTRILKRVTYLQTIKKYRVGFYANIWAYGWEGLILAILPVLLHPSVLYPLSTMIQELFVRNTINVIQIITKMGRVVFLQSLIMQLMINQELITKGGGGSEISRRKPIHVIASSRSRPSLKTYNYQ